MDEYRSQLFVAFIAALEQKNIRYCILGGYETYPEEIPSDVDFMVLPEQFPELYRILQSLAKANGAKLVQALQHETTACYYVWVKIAEDNLVFLHPDASSDYRRKGRVWLSAKEMLSSRRLHPNGFYIPAPEYGFIYYLIKKSFVEILTIENLL